ncbi:hypothetical protein AMECASPLE_001154 [Ameca splendens]|uniref:Uncharacterized protein n=1 Tax=Ameca splendens TaxID=208324 RepID=A0ABV0XYA6_9TELE
MTGIPMTSQYTILARSRICCLFHCPPLEQHKERQGQGLPYTGLPCTGATEPSDHHQRARSLNFYKKYSEGITDSPKTYFLSAALREYGIASPCRGLSSGQTKPPTLPHNLTPFGPSSLLFIRTVNMSPAMMTDNSSNPTTAGMARVANSGRKTIAKEKEKATIQKYVAAEYGAVDPVTGVSDPQLSVPAWGGVFRSLLPVLRCLFSLLQILVPVKFWFHVLGCGLAPYLQNLASCSNSTFPVLDHHETKIPENLVTNLSYNNCGVFLNLASLNKTVKLL